METVPFSSTSRGALLLTGGGSGWSRHRQQKRLEKRPPLLGFLEDREGEEPAEEEEVIYKKIRKTRATLVIADVAQVCLGCLFFVLHHYLQCYFGAETIS